MAGVLVLRILILNYGCKQSDGLTGRFIPAKTVASVFSIG